MRHHVGVWALLLITAAPAAPQSPTIKTNVDEVVLDLVVRDKKGKPVTDLKPEDLTVLDNDAKQTLTSFRLVRGAEAITPAGTATALDPLRQGGRRLTSAMWPLA